MDQDVFSTSVSLLHEGRHAEAIALIEAALPDQTRTAPLLNIAAICHQRMGDLAAAEHTFRLALAAEPTFADVQNNLGLLYAALGRKDEAVLAYQRALELDAGCLSAEVNLGRVFQDNGDLGRAEAAFLSVLAADPNYTVALYNLGNLYKDQGRAEEAEALYRRTLALNRRNPDALVNLGLILGETGRKAEAEAAYLEALSYNAADTNAACNLGLLLHGLGRLAEAEPVYRAALAHAPDHLFILNNLANLLVDLKRPNEAVEAYRASARDPGYAHPFGKLMLTQRMLCDWSDLPATEAAVTDLVRRGDAAGMGPFEMLIIPSLTPRDHRRVAEGFAARAHGEALARQPLVTRAPKPTDRLRIGYISSDFSDHATTWLFNGVLESHDKSVVSVHGFSTGRPVADRGRARSEAASDQFVDLYALSDQAAAQKIAEAGIDILVDLKGYTEENRLGIQARRPAPITVSWLGYPGTLGAPRLADYLIGDPVVTPLSQADAYSETLALMPHCYQPNDDRREIGPPVSRREAGLPDDALVLCNFNRSYKFSPETFALWMRLLRQLPDAVLWVFETNRWATDNLRAEAERGGVAADRLFFAPALSQKDHLGRLQCADIALDTFPYTSHTTGSDALWAGVPLVTKIGPSFASRVAASLLSAVGLPDLIVEDDAAYESLVVDLARDRSALATLRTRVGEARMGSPLFDTRGFARDLERLYRAIWTQEVAGDRRPIALAAV